MNIQEFFIHKYQNYGEISKSFIWRLIQIVSKQGTTALMFFIATFFLSKSQMGVYNYISSAVLLLVIFSDFGISTSTSRYIALYNVKDKDSVKRVFFNSFLMIFIISFVVITLALLLRETFFKEYSQYIPYALPMVFITPMTSLLDGMYRGLKRFKTLSIVSLLNSLVGIILSYVFVSSWGLEGAILAQVGYFSIYTITLLVLHTEYEFKIEKKILRDIGRYAISFGIATLGFYFFSKVNILILGNYNLFEEIAVYELLNKIYTIFLIPFTVLGQVIAPNIVEIHAKREYLKLEDMFKKILMYVSSGLILFIPISILLAQIVIHIFFPIYAGEVLSSLLLPVSLTYSIAIYVVIINTGILTSTGHAKLMAIQNLVSGAINLIVNILIIGRFCYIWIIWVTFSIQLLSTIFLYIFFIINLKKEEKVLVEK